MFSATRTSCGSSTASFLSLKQKSCNDHQVIRKYSGSDQQFEMLSPFGKTTLHASSAAEDRDSTLDAGAKSLSILEARAFLVGCLSRRLSSTALRNAHQFAPSVFALLDIVKTVKSAIGTVNAGSVT